MAEFPALTLWTDAYLSDTRHLTAIEHGAYLLLLMEAWRRPNCDLPDDDKMLARFACVTSAEWSEIRDTVMAFWKRDGRRKVWMQKRLLLERDRARTRSRVQSDKAAKRWKKTEKSDAAALPEKCHGNASTATATATDIEEEEPIGSPSSARASLVPGNDHPAAEKPPRKVSEEMPLPDGFVPVFGPKRAAMVAGWPPGVLDEQIERFRMHAVRNRRVAKDWNAAFGTWADKADKGIRAYAERGQNVGRSAPRHYPNRGGDGFTRALDRAEDALRSHAGSGEAEVPSRALD